MLNESNDIEETKCSPCDHYIYGIVHMVDGPHALWSCPNCRTSGNMKVDAIAKATS